MPSSALSPAASQGYVLHTYGPERYLRYAVASVVTLRRYDRERPVALYCAPTHRAALERHGLMSLFAQIRPLPEAQRTAGGFARALHRFLPFDRCLFVDADVAWCRDPDPLWQRLGTYGFTAVGEERAGLAYGVPTDARLALDVLLGRRRRTLRRFGLTHLPGVQTGLAYVQDADLAREVSAQAERFRARQDETHFRAGGTAGAWSLAMAMSRLGLPVVAQRQGAESPQLPFVEALTNHDLDFREVSCRYACDPVVHRLHSLPSDGLRAALTRLLTLGPGRGDYLEVTPFTLHFTHRHERALFHDFARRAWTRLTQRGQPSAEAEPKQLPAPANASDEPAAPARLVPFDEAAAALSASSEP